MVKGIDVRESDGFLTDMEREEYLLFRYYDILTMLQGRGVTREDATFRFYREKYIAAFVSHNLALTAIVRKYHPGAPFRCARLDYQRKQIEYVMLDKGENAK